MPDQPGIALGLALWFTGFFVVAVQPVERPRLGLPVLLLLSLIVLLRRDPR